MNDEHWQEQEGARDDLVGEIVDFGENEETNVNEEGVDDWDRRFSVMSAEIVEASSCASFDALTLVSLLAVVEPPSDFDIHTFSYLGCLLFVYQGNPASSWGYSFSAVPPTIPFSTTLSRSVDRLASSGLLEHARDTETHDVSGAPDARPSPVLERYRLTEIGREELAFLSSLHLMRQRTEYLTAATSTSLVYSVPAVINALIHEPQLMQAIKTQAPRALLAAASSRSLYKQFAALRDAMGQQVHHLSVPATVYVGYLEEQGYDDSGGFRFAQAEPQDE